MLIGHYGVAMVARAGEKRPPLWVYVGATQLLDIVWCILITFGIERFRAAPELGGSGLAFTFYPYSHSLAAALLWAVARFAVLKGLFRYATRPAAVVGLVVFSHWVLDLLVHRPDLELWPGGMRAGLGLWNYPVFERWLEVLVVLSGAAILSLALIAERRGIWRAAVFALVLITPFLFMAGGNANADPVSLGLWGLAFYLGLTVIAWLADRNWRHTAKS